MQHRDGFFLIDFLIYFVIATLLSLLLAGSAVRLYQAFQKGSAQQSHLCSLYSIGPLFRREIMRAPSEKSRWHQPSPEELIWFDEKNEACGWIFHNGKLKRKEGRYIKELGQWKKPAVSLVATNLKTCSFALDVVSESSENSRVRAITLKIDALLSDKTTYSLYHLVVLRNREVR